MAEFLTTTGITETLESIILDARKEIILVSPYLQLSYPIYEKLKGASYNQIAIKFIYGKKALKPADKKLLKCIKGLEVYFFKELHAKCYLNENKMIITSMNLYKYSQLNNKEMGISIYQAVDLEMFEKARVEVNSIIELSDRKSLIRTIPSKVEKHSSPANTKTNRFDKPLYTTLPDGHCIRCRKKVVYDLEQPYCEDCFTIWNKYQNKSYSEAVCHTCGENTSATMSKPECWECYSFE